MRQAGFLHLPTSRTLQDYATFAEPQSGWRSEVLDEKAKQYKPIQAPNADLGMFFDKVKIKESLLFDQSSNKPVGFVDFDSGNEEHPTVPLATRVTVLFQESVCRFRISLCILLD